MLCGITVLLSNLESGFLIRCYGTRRCSMPSVMIRLGPHWHKVKYNGPVLFIVVVVVLDVGS